MVTAKATRANNSILFMGILRVKKLVPFWKAIPFAHRRIQWYSCGRAGASIVFGKIVVAPHNTQVAAFVRTRVRPNSHEFGYMSTRLRGAIVPSTTTPANRELAG